MRLWKAGRPVRYEPSAAVWHFEFASSQSSAAPVELMLEHQKVFASRHAEALRDRPRRGQRPGRVDAVTIAVRKPRVLICDAAVTAPEKGIWISPRQSNDSGPCSIWAVKCPACQRGMSIRERTGSPSPRIFRWQRRSWLSPLWKARRFQDFGRAPGVL